MTLQSMPDLLELSLPVAVTDPESEAVTAAAELIDRYAIGGAVIELSGLGPGGERDQAQVIVRGYLPPTPANIHILSTLRQQLEALPEPGPYGEPRLRFLAPAEWTEAWKQHYHPLRVGQRLLICPPWETPPARPGDLIIRMDPGLAFGAGTHPSTQLILRLLEKHLRPGSTVLDIGTGSGILAIAATRPGAHHVYAIDIDAHAKIGRAHV